MRPLGILLSVMLLPIFICASDDLFPFKLGKDTFSQTVVDWHAVIMSNLVELTQKVATNSDIAKILRKKAEIGLNDLSKDKAMLVLAKKIYINIQQNEAVKQAFKEAKQATENKESLETRTEAWHAFRRVTAQQLNSMKGAELSHIKAPSPGSPNALAEFLELNKEVILADEQSDLLNAYNYVVFTFREVNHRIDNEVDRPNLLLHKKVTDPQN